MVQSVILTGPTATGKSSLAIEAAEKLNLEIINADSVCFYEKFNIGSAKPTLEELERVRHHLIDVVHPDDVYHAGRFIKDCKHALQDIHSRGKRALIVGGSGFYLKALRLGLWEAPATSPVFRETLKDRDDASLYEEVFTLDPKHAEKVGPVDRYRLIRALEILHLAHKKPSDLQDEMPKEPNAEFELWVIDRDKDELALRMRKRIEQMLDQGLVAETLGLLENYPESKMLKAVGYQQVIEHLSGIIPSGRKLRPGLPGLADEIELAHRQLAKQQRTWFKNMKPNESFILDQDHDLLIEKLMKFYQ